MGRGSPQSRDPGCYQGHRGNKQSAGKFKEFHETHGRLSITKKTETGRLLSTIGRNEKNMRWTYTNTLNLTKRFKIPSYCRITK